MTQLHVRQYPTHRADDEQAVNQPAQTDIVFLHGLFGSGDNFGTTVRRLAPNCRAIGIDLPGHGQSPTLPTLALPAMAAAVGQTLRSLRLNRPVLVGHSLGGKIAMLVAATNYTSVNGLVIADIAPRAYAASHTTIFEALSALPLATIAQRSDADRQLRADIQEPILRAFLLKNLRRTEAGTYDWRIDLVGLQRDYALLRAAIELPQPLSCPVMFIKGEHSDYLSEADLAALSRLGDDVIWREIAGTGHWLHAEKPAEFGALLDEFLAKLPPTSLST